MIKKLHQLGLVFISLGLVSCVTNSGNNGWGANQSKAALYQPKCTGSIWSGQNFNDCRILAEQGNAEAALHIAKAYKKCVSGFYPYKFKLESNAHKYIEWLGKAARLGNKKALRDIFDEYRRGSKVPKNDEKAEEFLRLAIDFDVEWALLISAYRQEETAPQSAFETYLKVARMNNCHAQKRLANAYFDGDIVERNPTQSYFWALLGSTGGIKRHSETHYLAAKGYSFSRSSCYSSRLSIKYKLESKLPKQHLQLAQDAASIWRVGDEDKVLEMPSASVMQVMFQDEKAKPKKIKSKQLAYSSVAPKKVTPKINKTKAVQISSPSGSELAIRPVSVRFAKKARRPDDVAVIIGNADYGMGKDIPNVIPAYADAKGIKNYVKQALGIREENIIFLKDATQAKMISTFGSETNPKGQLFNFVKPDVSRVFVYYSGHGAPGSNDGSSYIVPTNAEASSIDLNGYSLKTLYKNLSQIPAKSMTVVLEACFSGASQSGSVVAKASPINLVAKETGVPPNITVIAAGAANQIASWEQDSSSGLFTKYFLMGMSGKADAKPYGNGDGKVGYDELGKYLNKTVTYYARRYYGRDQKVQIVVGRDR